MAAKGRMSCHRDWNLILSLCFPVFGQFGSKPKVVASRPEARFEPPKIFSTDGYFPVSPTQSSTAVAAAAMEDDAS